MKLSTKINELIFSVALILLCSCAKKQSSYVPDPTRGASMTTTAGGFIIDQKRIKYNVKFIFAKAFTFPTYAEIDFEDPAHPGSFLVVASQLPARQLQFGATSPALQTIQNPANYTVKVTVYRDSTKGEVLAHHTQPLEFKMDPQILKTLLS